MNKPMSQELFDELSKQLAHAVRRPKKRVYVGRYVADDTEYAVFVSLEEVKK